MRVPGPTEIVLIDDKFIRCEGEDEIADWMSRREEYAGDIFAYKYITNYRPDSLQESIERFRAKIDYAANLREFKQTRLNGLQKRNNGIFHRSDSNKNRFDDFVFDAEADIDLGVDPLKFIVRYRTGFIYSTLLANESDGLNEHEYNIELRRVTAHEMYHMREAMLFPNRGIPASNES